MCELLLLFAKYFLVAYKNCCALCNVCLFWGFGVCTERSEGHVEVGEANGDKGGSATRAGGDSVLPPPKTTAFGTILGWHRVAQMWHKLVFCAAFLK